MTRILPLLRSALAWLHERWHRLDDNGPRTVADALGFVDSIRASEVAPELTVAPVTFGISDEPTQAWSIEDIPASPRERTPIHDAILSTGHFPTLTAALIMPTSEMRLVFDRLVGDPAEWICLPCKAGEHGCGHCPCPCSLPVSDDELLEMAR